MGKKKLGKAGGSEHRKGKRPSTKGKHQKGKARKEREREWTPGDARWRPPRRKPKGYKGPWPPPESEPLDDVINLVEEASDNGGSNAYDG